MFFYSFQIFYTDVHISVNIIQKSQFIQVRFNYLLFKTNVIFGYI